LVTVDTSAFVAALNRDDPNHDRAITVLKADRGPLLLPTGILAEVAYFVERGFGAKALIAWLDDVEAGVYRLDCGDDDIPRVRTLVARYADMPLGLADAVVIACAERNGGRVLTFDLRHFGVVAREGRIDVIP